MWISLEGLVVTFKIQETFQETISWVACLRFGGGGKSGIKKIPGYSHSDAAMSATLHVLRSEVRKYKKMEEEATQLWKKRGIEWND